MEWTDEGIVISARKHGENSVIADLFTRDHGRHKGLVRGGSSRKHRATLQPGSSVTAVWRGRLSEHLGSYTLEPVRTRAATLLDDELGLAGLSAACVVATVALPEREPHAALFEAFAVLLDRLEDRDVWPALYVRWELGLLSELGFGLDLSHCAATGTLEDLTYVSPKSGHAVSTDAAQPYKERLFRLPDFLVAREIEHAPIADILEGLRMSAHFLERRVLIPHNQSLPDARLRLAERLQTLVKD